MLERFRNKNSYLISTALILFAIMAKLFVPIVHASSAASGQKSFFASICSGHQVLITLDLSPDESPNAKIKSSSKCPLCSIVGQDTPIPITFQLALSFTEKPLTFTRTNLPYLPDGKYGLHAIRAPPTLS